MPVPPSDQRRHPSCLPLLLLPSFRRTGLPCPRTALRRIAGLSLLLLGALALAPAVVPAAHSSVQAQTPQPAPLPPAQSGIQDPAVPPTDTAVPLVQPAPDPPAEEAAGPEGADIMGRIDRSVGQVNAVIASVFFFDILFFLPDARLPLAVFWLVLGAIYFTIRMGFINFRAFRHAVHVVSGKYSNPSDMGEVSHFQALSTALSATVGLGNIAGVAIAVGMGGPGATFWMIVAGLLGMSSKFTECTLGQQYRTVRPDGHIMGGAMQYLSVGLAEMGWGRLGKVLAVLFAILCIGGSFGGGNSFQVNQSLNALQETVPFLAEYPWMYGVFMTVLVGMVIIGGIKRIAAAASKIVPLMCLVYILGALVIIIDNAAAVPAAFAAIFTEAFNPEALYGGFIGVLVIGFQRAAFSNEAGVGSAAIAHSAAKTPYPVREGIVALLEPFIDTVVVCTMTAVVIVVTGAYNNPAYADLVANNQGAALTSRAMGEHLTWFPYILSLAVLLFAYSTMISWSYYGERCWSWLFGDKAALSYRLLFLVFVFLGSIVTATNVLDFGDLMILGMAFPNILGVLMLSGKVRRELDQYWAKYKAGELTVYK